MIVLVVNSLVCAGHVGGRASVPVLEAAGHIVQFLPSAILSHHPGHGTPAVRVSSAEEIDAQLRSIIAHQRPDAVLTGWLGSAEVAAILATHIARLKQENPDLHYLCDPVIGDNPKGLYVAEDVAVAIRDQLLPLATITTPNRFELDWLTGQQGDDTLHTLQRSGPGTIICTSAPAPEGQVGVTALGPAGLEVSAQRPAIPSPPNGTGDMFAALALAGLMADQTLEQIVGQAMDCVSDAVAKSPDMVPRELAVQAGITAA